MITEQDKMTVTNGAKEPEQTLLDMLAQAGGEEEGHDFNMAEAKALLTRRQEREANQLFAFRKVFRYRPWDGAVAFQNVLMHFFGTAGIGKTTHTFFGDELPEIRDVPTGVDASIEVPWGRTAFPIFGEDAFFYNSSSEDDELGLLYELVFNAPKRFSRHIRGLFKEIEKELGQNSIYRGKCFTGQEMPQFVDLTQIDPSQVIYSEEVGEALKADLWSLIEHTELMRSLDIPLKHTVLLEGEYGTGKTLAGMVTAVKAMAAQENWTFILCRPGRDDYEDVMATARLYAPCVAFFEDIDTITSTGDDDELSRLLDVYDGATTKGAEVLAVLTTNHPARIHKAMVRPGRIDRIINVGKQDASSIERLIETSINPELIGELDYHALAEAMDHFTPSFVKESAHRAIRHAVARCDGRPEVLTSADFIAAAHSLRPHLQMMHEAGEGEKREGLDGVYTALVTDVMEEVIGRTKGDYDGSHFVFSVH